MKPIFLSLAACLLLTGCTASTPASAPLPPAPAPLQTGIATATTTRESQNATYDFPGRAQTDITLCAVLLDSAGVIRDCAIDAVSAAIPFDKTGALQLEEGTVFPSKNELGENYGLHKASPQGREWNQQAADYARWAVGKTPAELETADVVTSVTVDTDSFVRAIRCAAAQSAYLGAQEGDQLRLISSARMVTSHSAQGDDTESLARCRASAAAMTTRGEIITSCAFDGAESAVPLTREGTIAREPLLCTSPWDACSLRRRGDSDAWCRRAAAMAALATGKTPREAYTQLPAPPTGADTLPTLAVTVYDDFFPLFAKAAEG